MAKPTRFGMRTTAQQQAHLEALAAALETNTTGAIGALLDLPVGALTAIIQSVNVAQKSTAHQRQTGGAARAAASDGQNRLHSDTRGRNSHVKQQSTAN